MLLASYHIIGQLHLKKAKLMIDRYCMICIGSLVHILWLLMSMSELYYIFLQFLHFDYEKSDCCSAFSI